MDRYLNQMNDLVSFIKSALASLFTFGIAFFYPIHDFFIVIMILASANIVCGWLADKSGWSFKKAFQAILYLIGYMFLLSLTFVVGILMHQSETSMQNFASWITYVMIYFYIVNILRNWNIRQPENKVIEFLYWVITFKAVERIKYLREFNDYKHNKSNDTHGKETSDNS